MSPCGCHGGFEFLKPARVRRQQCAQLFLMRFFQIIDELIARDCVRRKFSIQENAKVSIGLFLIGLLLERGIVELGEESMTKP